MIFVNGRTSFTFPIVTGPAERDALMPPPLTIVKSAPDSAVIAWQISFERFVFLVLTLALSPSRSIGRSAITAPNLSSSSACFSAIYASTSGSEGIDVIPSEAKSSLEDGSMTSSAGMRKTSEISASFPSTWICTTPRFCR